MAYITESSKQTPVVFEADICVIGGGCTGVFAAVRAARLGARVAIIENNGFFGGVATAGLVSIWHSLFDWEYKQQIIAGLSLEVIERLKKHSAVVEVNPPTPHRSYLFNPEELKIELDCLIAENNIRPFLHTKFVAPVHENGRVSAVVIEDKTGRRAITAKFFIDASGDGDLIARMGLPFVKYSELQPPTAIAVFENIKNIYDYDAKFNISSEVHDPKHPNALKQGFLWSSEVVGRPEAEMIAGTRVHNADCSDADQLTQAEMECRRQIRVIGDILRSVKGGERIVLSSMAAYIGIRETRHAGCLYQLNREDILSGKKFDDAIGYGTYGVDIHHSNQPGARMQYLDGTECSFAPGRPNQWSRWREESAGITPYYQIPYRSLVPEGAENVLAAGRLIGADKEAFGAIRVMINCNQTGEAAGVAAWEALSSGKTAAGVDTGRIRKSLAGGGSIII